MPNRMKEPHATKKLRKLASGRFQARVTYWDPETGKRRETTRTFPTERDAKKWKTAQEMQFRQEPNQKAPATQTLADFFEEWLAITKARGLAQKTLRDYRQMAVHAINAFGHKPLKNITTWEIQQLYAALAETHASRTVNYVHTVLNRACADAVDWGLISVNPALKAKAPRGRRRTVEIMTPEEARRFLDATRESRWYVLWAFMLHTGLRPGEAIAVRWQDINWDAAILHVMQAVSGDGKDMELSPTKTERSTRPVALGPHCLDLLRDRQSEQRIERAQKGSAWEDQDLVFSTRDGRLLSPNNIRRAFRKDRIRAGLSSAIHPHCLRHSMASHWLAAGHSIKVVSERLGHTSIAFTLQTYAHLLPNQQADAAAAMDAALFADPIPTTNHTSATRTSELGDTAPNAIRQANAEAGSTQRFGEQEQTVRDIVNTPVYDS